MSRKNGHTKPTFAHKINFKLKYPKLLSIFKSKCPKCLEGDVFVVKNAYKLKTLTDMHKSCSACGEDFKREPGFYFGAAYVSYGLTIALWVAVIVALYTFDALGWIDYAFFKNPTLLLITGISTLLVLLPVLFRVSRMIWINMFVKHVSSATEEGA